MDPSRALPPPAPRQTPKERLPRIGEVVSGKYRVAKFLGMGGMGKVMAAEHIALRQPVAIKFLHPHLVTSKTAQRRFAREARASALLHSPHAVRILDVDQLDWGAPYLVMEHLEGYSLEKLIFEHRLPDAFVAVRWTIQACDALGEAHARGIVHRDIKPENLFLATLPSGVQVIKVLDLGLAKWHEDDSLSGTAETATNAAVGSPQYMSPEQITGKPVDHRADLWSLGATLYELLTGTPPFVARTVQDLFRRILHAPLRPLGELRPDLPHALTSTIMRCLERDPARRWRSAGELAGALEASIAGRPERTSTPAVVHDLSIPPPPPTTVRRPRPAPDARGQAGARALVAAGAVATIVAAAVSTFALGMATTRGAFRSATPPPAAASALPTAAVHASTTKPPATFE